MVLTSADGATWQVSLSKTGNHLRSITYCDDRYVITGALDTPEKLQPSHRRVYVSPDGKNWSAMSMTESLTFFGVACGSDRALILVGKKILQSDPLPEVK
jgi:streptogramin lyase